MVNSIKFMNEGFDAKYGNIKPDLCEEIYNVLKRLTEAKMSPEDEKDTELLYSIYDKKMKRSNAALTPEEKSVLKKYNLKDPQVTKNYFGKNKVHVYDSESGNLNVFKPVTKGNNNRNVNLADRARKMGQRNHAKSDIGKYDVDYKNNYAKMQNIVNNRNYNQRGLDAVNKRYDDLEAELRSRLDTLNQEREQDTNYYKNRIQSKNYEIDKMLKR